MNYFPTQEYTSLCTIAVFIVIKVNLRPKRTWRHVKSKLHFIFKSNAPWTASLSFSSVQFSCSVMSDSLRPHELQHARLPCPSTPGVHSDSCPSSLWCHPAISSSVVTFSSCPQSLPASESFPMSQLFAWGGQSTGVSALASVLPKKPQGWSPSEWPGWISCTLVESVETPYLFFILMIFVVSLSLY